MSSATVEKPKVGSFSSVKAWEGQCKPKSCTTCPLYEHRFVLQEPVSQTDILIIVDPPEYEDTENSDLSLRLRTSKWKTFNDICNEISHRLQATIRIEHVIPCTLRTTGEKKKKLNARTNRKCSSMFLLPLIQEIKPKAVVTMGSDALRALGYKCTTNKVRGHIVKPAFPADWGCWVVPTYSIDEYLSYKGKYKLISTLQLDIEKAIHIAKNGYQPFDSKKIQQYCSYPKTDDEIRSFVETVKNSNTSELSFDIETLAPGIPKPAWLNPRHPDASVTVISFSWSDTEAAAIDCRNLSPTSWGYLKDLLESDIPKSAHNAKFDVSRLDIIRGIKVKNLVADTMNNHYLVDENRAGGDERNLKGEYSLKRLVWDYMPQYGGYEEAEGVSGVIEKGIVTEEAFAAVVRYGAMDSLVTRKLSQIQKRLLNDLPPEASLDEIRQNLKKLYVFSRTSMIDAVKTIIKMETRGVYIDTAYLESIKSTVDPLKSQLLGTFRSEIGPHFNPNANADVASFLYNRLGLKVLKKTDTGAPSTDEEVLEGYADQHNLVRQILNFKKLSKLQSSFINKAADLIDPRTNRVYPSYKLEGTKTGRLSCSDPNIQQFPDTMGIGKYDEDTGQYETSFNVKKLFVATPGYTMLGADYRQIEVVVLACYSKDPKLIEAIESDYDIHSYIASMMFEIPYEEIVANKKKEPYKSMRRKAKTVTFGIIYGSTGEGMAKKQGWEPEEATQYINAFMSKFPLTIKYVEEQHNKVRHLGYVTTFFHRKRRFPILKWKNWDRRSLRGAQNAPIQSTASDICLHSCIELETELEKIGGHVLMPVHDAIYSEVPTEQLKEGLSAYQSVMVEAPKERYPWLITPLRIDLGSGPSWGELN